LTREVEFAGERLGVTLTAESVTIRPVGGRKPPVTISWSALLTLISKSGHDYQPTADELRAAVAHIKAGGPAVAPKPAADAVASAAPAPAPAPVSEAPSAG
jgi:hypothetical protein